MSAEEIRKIALEFFKDKFSSLYKKQKELEKTLEALEKKFKVVTTNIDEMGADLHEQIAELKELSERNRKRVDELKDFRHDVAMPRIITIEEVLRELLKKYSEHEDSTIHKSFYIGLLEKLDSPTLQDPYYACGKEKTDKKEYPGVKEYCDFMDNIEKDSGGSNSGVEAPIRLTGKIPLIEPDEKLPEPIDGTTYAVDTTKEADPEKDCIKDYIARFQVLQGRWGMYFHDSKEGKSLTLIEVESLLNTFYTKNLKLIDKFLERMDWIMERIAFHTENADSELMDEIAEEYEEWQGMLKK